MTSVAHAVKHPPPCALSNVATCECCIVTAALAFILAEWHDRDSTLTSLPGRCLDCLEHHDAVVEDDELTHETVATQDCRDSAFLTFNINSGCQAH